MRITGVTNQKGGVGKTAVVAGVAGALAERGRRVLVRAGRRQRASGDRAQAR